MNRPYVICHMMSSVDGRIDCPMTAKLKGVEEYYTTLAKLEAPSVLSGRVTAELELALPGKFTDAKTYVASEIYKQNLKAQGYNIVVDTKGTLLWPKQDGQDTPTLVITSLKASCEYLAYLDEQKVSYIVTGQDHIDLKRALEILKTHFNVQRLAVVGGPLINGGFLAQHLLDEVSIVIGAGIDGRSGQVGVFEGLKHDGTPISLNLKEVKALDSQAVWLRYSL